MDKSQKKFLGYLRAVFDDEFKKILDMECIMPDWVSSPARAGQISGTYIGTPRDICTTQDWN